MTDSWDSILEHYEVLNFLRESTCPSDHICVLWCGHGKVAESLAFAKFIGYDSSALNILYASMNESPIISFSCVDIMRFSANDFYDLIIALDSQVLFDNSSITRIKELWKANKYIFIRTNE